MIDWSICITGFAVGLFGGTMASLLNTIITGVFGLITGSVGKE